MGGLGTDKEIAGPAGADALSNHGATRALAAFM
jgi:hypothetical protein